MGGGGGGGGEGLTDCEAGCVRALVVTYAFFHTPTPHDNGDTGIIVEVRIGGPAGLRVARVSGGLRVARVSGERWFGHDIMINKAVFGCKGA